LAATLGPGRGVTPPRRQSLPLRVGIPQYPICEYFFLVFGGLGQLWSALHHSPAAPNAAGIAIQTSGRRAPTVVPYSRSLVQVVLQHSVVQSAYRGTRLLALDQTGARRCFSYLRCALDQPLSRRRCPPLQDLQPSPAAPDAAGVAFQTSGCRAPTAGRVARPPTPL
jgi:hypothetical protein